MTAKRNPFEFAGANDLPADMVLDYYIEDFNYSRFVQSKRNLLLVGERGCGKSMTLLYNSWPLQQMKAERDGGDVPLEHIGIYVPCKTPLIHKTEYQLLDELRAAMLSEHTLVLSLLYAVAETLGAIPGVLDGAEEHALRSRLEFILESDLPPAVSFFEAVMDFTQKANLKTQETVTDSTSPSVTLKSTYSFASLIVPVLGLTRAIPKLKHSHFMFLIDDAHDLNERQLESLSSWIAYRDHSLFSFKVAIANIAHRKIRTASGGAILEGHDYIRLDMAQPYQSKTSNFGNLAKGLVRKRLARFGIDCSPAEFFPVSQQLQEDLAKAEAVVRAEAQARYRDDSKRIADYVYKYKRAHYFRDRSPRANLPEYSGFTTLVFLSTGVIRNLLIPCYAMYDKMISLQSGKGEADSPVDSIPPNVQSEVIIDESRKRWDWLRNGIDQNIVGCSNEDARRCYCLLNQLAILFWERLLHHKSEPRANSFTVSSPTDDIMHKLNHLFDILREAQLLYVRSGSAKDRGKREWYYVPNRLLWPERGLDPHGQHARVSLRATDLWAAADMDRPLPHAGEKRERNLELFNEPD